MHERERQEYAKYMDDLNYFEASHVYKFSDGDPDHTEHVVAICPHCHARIHR